MTNWMTSLLRVMICISNCLLTPYISLTSCWLLIFNRRDIGLIGVSDQDYWERERAIIKISRLCQPAPGVSHIIISLWGHTRWINPTQPSSRRLPPSLPPFLSKYNWFLLALTSLHCQLGRLQTYHEAAGLAKKIFTICLLPSSSQSQFLAGFF